MERADRAPVATFYAPGAWTDKVDLGDAAAHHATVKRVAYGDVVRLTSGDGRRALGEIAELSKRSLIVAVDGASLELVPEPSQVELLAPVGDRERMLWLAEKAVELGVSAWRPVVYRRSKSVSPRGEGAAFRDKLRLRQVGALEQSGGAWLPRVHDEEPLDALLERRTENGSGSSLLLDVDGESLGRIIDSVESPVRIALGPEGGLEESERALFIRAGWRPVSLGANILRFETAGIAAVAIVRSHLG